MRNMIVEQEVEEAEQRIKLDIEEKWKKETREKLRVEAKKEFDEKLKAMLQ